MKIIFLMIWPVLTVFFSAAQVPPPLGPPPVPAGVASSDIDFGTLTNLIRTGVQRSVNGINHTIDSMSGSTGVKAKLSFRFTSVLPLMLATSGKNTPNFNTARLWINAEYTVSDISYHSIPYFSRKIFQKISVTGICKDWQTENGHSEFWLGAEKPYLDNASFSEQALNFFIGNTLTAYVDSKLKQSLSTAGGGGVLPFGNANPCNCMSMAAGTGPNHQDGFVSFYKKFVRPVVPGMGDIVYSIQLKSVKRLPMTIAGQVSPETETIALEYYGNHVSAVVNIENIREGEIRNIENVILFVPFSVLYDKLVVIAGITPQDAQPAFTESGFISMPRGNILTGEQVIKISKAVSFPASRGPNGEFIKPRTGYFPYYELTFEIGNNILTVNRD